MIPRVVEDRQHADFMRTAWATLVAIVSIGGCSILLGLVLR